MIKKYLLFVILSTIIFLSCKTTPESTTLVASVLPGLTSYPYLGVESTPEKATKEKITEEKKSIAKKETTSKSEKENNTNTALYPPYNIRETERGRILVFSDKILFTFQGYTVNKKYINTLLYIKSFLKDYPNAKVIIEAHTDKTGKEQYNQKLSARRASETAKKLISMGVKKSQIIQKPLGEAINEYPKSSENRRVEFVIIEGSNDLKNYENYIKKLRQK